MNTYANGDHPKSDLRPARRIGIVKAEPVAGLERTATTPFGFIGAWKRFYPATGPEDFRGRGRSLGTRFDEIFPDFLVWLLTETLDTSGPCGRLMMNMLGAFNQFEREIIKERTMLGLLRARANGRIGGGRYKLTPKQQQQAIVWIRSGEKTQSEVAEFFSLDRSTVSPMTSEGAKESGVAVMWLFTETGFYSVVIDAQNQGRMLIRCRCAIDAANLWKNHHDALPSMTEPVSREDRDYRWRLSISRRDWIKLAGRLAETVQYDNFKSAVHRNPSQGSKSGSYLRIWSTMADLQRSETHGDVVKRHQPDDAAAWQSFVAKVDKPVTTKPVKRKAAKKLWRS